MAYVYMIEGGGLYKLGVSVSPEGRLAQLQTGSGHPLRIVAAGEYGDRAYAVESALHQRYAAHRQNGEWFALPAEAADEVAWWLSITENGTQVAEPQVAQVSKPHSTPRRSLWSLFHRNSRRTQRATTFTSKAELAREWFNDHPEHLNKPGRWLEENVRPQNVKISYKYWTRIANELKERS